MRYLRMRSLKRIPRGSCLSVFTRWKDKNMQSPIDLHGVSFRQKPRDGQRWVFDEVVNPSLKELNVKLPTGYGKTFTAAGVYAIRQKHFGLNRLLYITPTTAQHEAFCLDGHHDLSRAGVIGPHQIVDVSYLGITQALRKHRGNANQVFGITIQGICASGGDIAMLLETGRWMIVVDEYHHYGVDKTWGQRIRALNAEFILAMSATPYRPNEDSAFGEPIIDISYRKAVEECAIKKLIGHAYIYKIDAINADGEIESITTSELAALAGSSDPEKIEKYKIERKMRWSPKYVSPLVSIPIERMLSDRISSGHKLQAIVGAMCVSHAELVCEQLKAMFPELAIDWVGTGTNGRSREVNQEIIRRFCPPKEMDSFGEVKRAEPTLDVLVHVGMAGEGLDTCNVSEVVFLHVANINNSNNQASGRSSRWLDGGIVGNVNYDSTSEYAEYVGEAIMDAMDFLPPKPNEDDDRSREPKPLPEEPTIRIWDMELIRVDSGNPEVGRFAKALQELGHTVRTLQEMVDDPNQSELDNVIELFKRMRQIEAAQHNEKSRIEQWRESVDAALSLVTSRVIKAMQRNGQRIEKSLPGDIKKRINQKKKTILGAVVKDQDILRKHYQWLQRLEASIIESGIPAWLQ